MGYTKNPGSFRDTIGLLFVLLFLFEVAVLFIAVAAGDVSLFVDLHKTWGVAFKETFLR